MYTLYKATINKDSVLDDYENGEVGENNCFGLIHTETASEPEMLIEQLCYFLDIEEKEIFHFDDRLTVNILECDNGTRPTEYEVKLWKDGLKKLYSATYDIYIEKQTIDDELNLKALLPKLEEI